MKRKIFSEEKIISILNEQAAGAKVKDIIRRHGSAEQTFYRWKNKYGGMGIREAKGPRTIALNRKARYNDHIEEDIEAGIVLTGTEVKSLRAGEANITDAYAEAKDDEIFLINAYIKEYEMGNRFNHSARRPRKLLLHKREVNKIAGAIQRKGKTLVPLSIYFNGKNRVKVKIGLAAGKKLHDRQAPEKERDWNRQKSRLMKDGHS